MAYVPCKCVCWSMGPTPASDHDSKMTRGCDSTQLSVMLRTQSSRPFRFSQFSFVPAAMNVVRAIGCRHQQKNRKAEKVVPRGSR